MPPKPVTASWASSEAARRTMVANRGRDTGLELAVRSLVHARGLRYYVDRRPLKGLRRTADLLFPRRRIAVFLDGCFWHRCPEHFQMPAANRAYWGPKIDRNVERDRETNRQLFDAGWQVLRFWEHETPTAIADQIELTVRQATSPTPGS
ncbi:very short patch repair endonuclease [Geodermatophilus normandii]|uniref:very short patch repair endonuclease n=1 Tax=Geodermatophilus normandii TaxID=1137989 RepID=UPI001FEB6AB9|nr:very short patch repair endonuclease [Geodermatophilus normandii]